MDNTLLIIKRIPNYIWAIILISYLIPILISEQLLAFQIAEMRWFLLLIPVFFFSYYFGLWGGLISSFFSNILIILKEVIETYLGEPVSYWEPFMLFIICLISFSIAWGIGLLASQLTIKQQELALLSITDPLTNLYNRRYIDSIKQKKKSSKTTAVIFLDLDRFKLINDSLGHHIGDLMLQNVSKRLQECIDPLDTIIRIGGDEFVIVTQQIKSIQSKANIVLKTLAKPYHIDRHELYLSASLGISVGYGTIHEIIEKADIAMNWAKQLGKNRYEFFEEQMTTNAVETIKFVNDLHKVLENKELFIHYQPKVDVASKELIGVEALIRWNHPKYGVVSPDKFIPVAEDMGMIMPIGEWVLRTACIQMKELIDLGYTVKRMAVNISARQFQSNIVETVKKILVETKLDPNYLELEITESILLFNIDEVSSKLSNLKDLGIFLSVDDFGIGYSSLSYLKKLPIDCLKIDKSFVKDMITDPSIVRAIIMLGRSLGLHVIAEGIETKIQEEMLVSEHCHRMQGYLYSPPIPFNELKTFIRDEGYILCV